MNMTYQQKKLEFLDTLKPDDFRNGGSFNQAEEIIDELLQAAMTKKNPQEFIIKAASHLFRENSMVTQRLIKLVMESV